MRKRTKIGLILIVAVAFAGSLTISVLSFKFAMRANGKLHETGEPMRHMVPSVYRVSADI